MVNNKKDEIYFVQFPHPGGEHPCFCNSSCRRINIYDCHNEKHKEDEWNRCEHGRKFLKVSGNYVTNPKKWDECKDKEIFFWGEWEPESKIEEDFYKIKNRENGQPRFIRTPYYNNPKSYLGLQNTDPFVFGNEFYYSNCRQSKNGKLRLLAQNSLILFGSKLDGKFVLDTLFVVNEHQIYNAKNSYQLRGINNEFRNVVLTPLSENANRCPCSCEFSLYSGVKFEDRGKNKGMFSFFPCKPCGNSDKSYPRFCRPVITLDEDNNKDSKEKKINPTNSQAAKCRLLNNADDAYNIWSEVVSKIIDEGLALGIKAELPEMRDGTD